MATARPEAQPRACLVRALPPPAALPLCLPGTVAVIGLLGASMGNNIDRADKINLYDDTGALADRLTYDDQDIADSPRANGESAWVSIEGIGQNDPTRWAA